LAVGSPQEGPTATAVDSSNRFVDEVGLVLRGNDKLVAESLLVSGKMLSPDTILQGRYRIVRQLGQGGMGAVYEAVDQRLDTVVALKETLFTDEKLRKQFEREARLLARLHHQALPRVSDHFNESEGQFLVMQYIPGEDLFEMQTRRKDAFSPKDVLRWADQLCDALDYLHTQDPQIIHRDIKPQNLKLTARGQIVLLDFGLAKGSAGQMSVVTTSASIFGYTPNYAPLEQVQGLGTDPRSDIYSLAATLYHLLTNVKPPDALSRAGAIVNGLPDPLAPAETVSHQVSRSVAAVLEKGMSQKRDDRYASAEEMRAAFRVADGQPAGEAPTVLTLAAAGTKANTVSPAQGTQIAGQQTKAFGNEAQTLLVDDATKVRASTASIDGGTVIQSAGRKRTGAWLAAAILLVVIVGGAGGFYIYRARKSQTGESATPTTQNPIAPAEPAPTATTPVETSGQTATTEPTPATPRTETTNQRAKSAEAATKASKPAVDNTNDETFQTANPNTNRDRAVQEPPKDSSHRPPDLPHPARPGAASPSIVTLSNGTRVETRSDGTRIITLPDGRTRVFPPGTGPKPNRKRRIPN